MQQDPKIRKVLFLAPTGQLGGAERCLVDTIWSLRQEHPDLNMQLITGSEGPLIDSASQAGVNTAETIEMPSKISQLGDAGLKRDFRSTLSRLLQLLTSLPSTFQYANQLRQKIKKANPDIVHVLGLKMQLLSLFAAPLRYPLVWNIQDYIGHRRLTRHLIRFSLFLFGFKRKLAAGCCSNDVSADFKLVSGSRFNAVSTIYNTIDLGRFKPDGPRIKLPDSNSDTICIGLIATYARWKGQDLFLQSLAILNQNISLPAWHAYIIGGPIYTTAGSQWTQIELEKIVEDSDISGKVTFLPFLPDPTTVLRSLQIAVHASTNPEPFGRVIAEAQACGCATIAVGSGGSAEAFQDESSGLGFQMRNSDELARQIARLLCNKELRNQLAANGPLYVANHFDRKELAGEWLQVYGRIF